MALMRKLGRALMVLLGIAFLVFAFACAFFAYSHIIREAWHDATWHGFRNSIAILLYIATGIIAVAITALNIKKKLDVEGEKQFMILLAYLLTLAIWGLICLLPVYLLLGR
jgi:hypothetical protein